MKLCIRPSYFLNLKWDAQPRKFKKTSTKKSPPKKAGRKPAKKIASSSKAHSKLATAEKAILVACKMMAAAHKLYIKAKSAFPKADAKVLTLETKAARLDH